MEGAGIFLLEVVVQITKQAPLRTSAGIPGSGAGFAEPLALRDGVALSHGRVDTEEVQRASAAIAAHQLATTATGAAVVVVVILHVISILHEGRVLRKISLQAVRWTVRG